MDLTHIHHVAVIGSDYEKSKHFYVDLLGLEVISEHYREEQQDWIIYLRLADAVLELFIKQGCPKRSGWPGQEAYGLHAAGIETEPIRKDIFAGESMTFFHDPDGLPIELTPEELERYSFAAGWVDVCK